MKSSARPRGWSEAVLRPATPSTVGSPKVHPRNCAAVRTNGLTAPSCPVSSPQSATAAGALSGSARRPTRRACSAARRSSSSRRPPTPPRPAPPAPAPRAPAPPWRGRRRPAGVLRPGPGRRRRRARRCPARRPSVAPVPRPERAPRPRRGDGTRAAAPRCVARVSSWPGGSAPVPARATAPPVTATVAAVASPTPRSTGAGTGTGTRTGDIAPHGVRRPLPNSRPAGTGGSGARGGLGGSDAEPRPTFRTRRHGWTSGSGGPAGGESRVHSVTVSS